MPLNADVPRLREMLAELDALILAGEADTTDVMFVHLLRALIGPEPAPRPAAVTEAMMLAAVRSLCVTAGKNIYKAFRNDAGLEKAVTDALTAALAAREG